MKKCPYCAEDIQDAAVVCKHCGKNVSAASINALTGEPKKRPSATAMGCLIVLVVVGALALIGSFMAPTPSTTTPAGLTAVQQEAIAALHRAKAWQAPRDIEVRNGIVVVNYQLPAGALGVRQQAEDRLLAIREILLRDGYDAYRVNMWGPPPGTGLVRRYGAARYLGGGKVEWLTD